ncbi:SirB2 family protein [Lysobacter solisilvae (ex Woo and Kim 2020)]|uniref:SirB2 family protein n=1 Tax=Agrilutibacter terrestris TaxID=2865112 RepID=A0A7H0FWL1_9GAMM|nr:SirB2 family protein [Lysobacter terrestris]QNP40427.1 SirB2 family protein [Lysobacter terrestris]
MIEFYPQIRQLHILVALLSGTLFALRGGFLLAGARWPLLAPVRWLNYAIDTVLLTAALMLVTILPGAVFANGWLLVKIALLVVYIVLGVFALKRAKTRRARLLCYLAALTVFLSIYATARTHQPLGALTYWFS